MTVSTSINLLTATATELQNGLTAGTFKSTQLVDLYLDQISKQNDYLKVVIETAPRSLLQLQASQLDLERLDDKLRGPLHGIPILLKDNIATYAALGLETTAGSLALLGSRPRRNAEIVEKLIKAGAIILGKANLSELSNYRSEGIPSGWSARGGQCQSAYVRGGFRDDDSPSGHSNPGGSSSGSAVAVSAGFCPLSIGTETIGSLISPSDKAALYTIKPTIGLISQDGIIPISHLCDSAGPMTKSARDLALLLDILVDSSATKVSDQGYIASVTDPPYIQEAEDQMTQEIEAAYEKLRSVVDDVFYVSLISKQEASADGEKNLTKLLDRDLGPNFENYLANVDNLKIHNLADLIKFNQDHADVELPKRYDNQNVLLNANNSTLSNDEYNEILAFARKAGRDLGIDKTLKENGVDVIIGPAFSGLSYIAAAAGYPIASLPLSYLDYNGRPFGLAALAGAHQEALLVQVQSAWEATFPPRRPPPLLEA